MNYWVIFLTGLTTGGLSCLAVQGGLLASVIAGQKDSAIKTHDKNSSARSFDAMDWMPVGMFLIMKLLAHVAFGFLLGAIGSTIVVGVGVRLFFQTLAALFIFATAMNLLEVHPIFRYAALQPPRFLQRWVHKSSKSKAFFAPALLGLLTIFIPCGVTQAMEVLVLQSANPIYGAIAMGVFVLGTFPLFTVIGIATAKFSEFWKKNFLRVAAYILIFMALYSLNGVLKAMDAPISFDKIAAVFTDSSKQGTATVASNDSVSVQKVTITINNSGYSPRRIEVKAGKPVELTLVNNDSFSCASSFMIRAFNVYEEVGPNEKKVVTFAPQKPGRYTFSCSMGMYTGVIDVK